MIPPGPSPLPPLGPLCIDIGTAGTDGIGSAVRGRPLVVLDRNADKDFMGTSPFFPPGYVTASAVLGLSFSRSFANANAESDFIGFIDLPSKPIPKGEGEGESATPCGLSPCRGTES